MAGLRASFDAVELVAAELDDIVAGVTTADERQGLYRRIVDRVRTGVIPPNRITREDTFGAIASFWLVFLASLPAAVPFLFIDEACVALRVSNAILLALLFYVGYVWARHTMAKPLLTGCVFLLGGVAIRSSWGGWRPTRTRLRHRPTVKCRLRAEFWSVRYYMRQSDRMPPGHGLFSQVRPLLIAMVIMMLGNFLQIIIWGVLFLGLGEFRELYEAVYHSAVNFSSLGYGDVVMSARWKLLGPLAAGSGVLMFAMTSAALMAILQQLIRTQFAVGRRD